MNNLNFETWVNGSPSSWTLINNQNIYPLTIQQEVNEKTEGNFSVKITANQPHQGIEQEITNDMLGKTIKVPIKVMSGYAGLELVKDGTDVLTQGARHSFFEEPETFQEKTVESPLNRTGVPIKCPVSGDIIYTWIYGTNTNGEMDINRKIMARRGDKNCKNWGANYELGLVLPSPWTNYFIGGSLTLSNINRIILFVAVRNATSGENGNQVYTTISDDDGYTWSTLRQCFTTEQLANYSAIHCAKASPIKLQSGTILATFTVVDSTNWKNATGWNSSWYNTVIGRSTDGGLTYQLFDLGYTNSTTNGSNGEMAIVELDNGTIKGMVRTATGYLYETTGTNDGQNWTTLTATDWASPEVNCTLKKLKNGKIIFLINNYGTEIQNTKGFPRPRLTGFLSDGMLIDYNNPFLIDQDYVSPYTPDALSGNPSDDDWVSYPEIVELDDGNIVVFYDHATEDSHWQDGIVYWFMEIKMTRSKLGWRSNENYKNITTNKDRNSWVYLYKYIPNNTPTGTKLRLSSIRNRTATYYVDNIILDNFVTNENIMLSTHLPIDLSVDLIHFNIILPIYSDANCTILDSSLSQLSSNQIHTIDKYIKNNTSTPIAVQLYNQNDTNNVISYSWDGITYIDPSSWKTIQPDEKVNFKVKVDLTTVETEQSFSIGKRVRSVV